jgi:hypothetical protein
MKKNVLASAVAGAVAATSLHAVADADSAMYLNDRLTGEALVLPFYSAQNGNNTYFNLVNTTAQYKAVKIRIVEAWNSQEVLDFNLYMSPKDHFSFNIKADGEGAQLVTVDNSCTVPEIPKVDAEDVTPPIKRAVSFRNTKYSGDKGGTGATAYDYTGEFREQIGYIEVIEMGQIDPTATATVDPLGKVKVAAAIKHKADGIPLACNIVVAGWSSPASVDGKWLAEWNDATIKRGKSEMLATWAGGGLYAYGTILNIAEGTAVGEDAVAIEQFWTPGTNGWTGHQKPGSTFPDFNDDDINKDVLVSVPGSGSPELLEFASDEDDFVPVSALFMASNVMNDYVVDPTIAADTDWVLTFPTKRFHVNTTPVVDPFTIPWTKATASACEPSTLNVFDREEAYTAPPSSGPDFSPAPPTQDDKSDLLLCYESTVLQFGDDSTLNVTGVATGVGSLLGDYTEGWADLDISEAGVTDTYKIGTATAVFGRKIDPATGVTLEGLPVTGFAAISYVNSDTDENVAGVLANNSSSTEHKTSVMAS